MCVAVVVARLARSSVEENVSTARVHCTVQKLLLSDVCASLPCSMIVPCCMCVGEKIKQKGNIKGVPESVCLTSVDSCGECTLDL